MATDSAQSKSTASQNNGPDKNGSQGALPEPLKKITDSKPVQDAQKSDVVQKGVKPLQGFFTKFNNDGVMNFSAALAYNLLTAMVPIAFAIIALIGLAFGWLAPNAQSDVLNQIVHIFPSQVSSDPNLSKNVLLRINQASGLIGIIAILAALFGGSRLFVLIEYIFGIIYHVRQRKVVQQNLMALGMLFIFVLLIPVMIFASTLPTLAFSLVQSTASSTPIGGLLKNPVLTAIISAIGGVLASFLLFVAIYIVVPNQKISFKNSWKGAIVAAVLAQIYLLLFPIYISHFLNGYVGQVGFALILIAFFYYFAVILLLGAEVNAFFAESVLETPDTLVNMVHVMTSHMPTSEEDIQKQAAADHKDVQPKGVFVKGDSSKQDEEDKAHTTDPNPQELAKSGKSSKNKSSQSNQDGQKTQVIVEKMERHHEGQRKASSDNTLLTVASVAAGTTLTFVVEMFRSRQKAR